MASTYKLLNDDYTGRLLELPSSDAGFPFPRLPPELRDKIWEACFPAQRFITIKVGNNRVKRWPTQDSDDGSTPTFSATNNLGNIVSGWNYGLHVDRFDPLGRWPLVLQRVCRESNRAYHAFYRLSLPLDFGSGPEYGPDGFTDDEGNLYGRFPLHHRLHLNPESDIISVRCAPDRDKTNVTTPYLSDLLEGVELPIAKGELMAALLHDARAFDPRGVGLARLGLGTGRDRNSETKEVYHSVVRIAKCRPGSREGFRRYFDGFGLTSGRKKQTNTFFAIEMVDVDQNRHGNPVPCAMAHSCYRSPHNYFYWPQILRHVPVFPAMLGDAMLGKESIQTVVLSHTFDRDPRIQSTLMHSSLRPFSTRAVKFNIGSSTRIGGPRRHLFYWRKMLAYFGVECDLANKVRFLASVQLGTGTNTVWQDFLRRRNRELGLAVETGRVQGSEGAGEATKEGNPPACHTREGFLSALRMQDLNRAKEVNDTAVSEVAGVWIFKADACGPIPDDDGEGDWALMSAGEETKPIFLSKHEPELMLFELS